MKTKFQQPQPEPSTKTKRFIHSAKLLQGIGCPKCDALEAGQETNGFVEQITVDQPEIPENIDPELKKKLIKAQHVHKGASRKRLSLRTI